MKTKNILIGGGVLVLGYLLLKKGKNNVQPINIQTIVKEPSEVVANKNIPRGGLAMPLQDPDLLTLSRIPNEFTVNSNGFSTRYYKNILQTKTGFSSMFATPDVYKQPFKPNSDSGVQPIKISVREFSDAYYGMKPDVMPYSDKLGIPQAIMTAKSLNDLVNPFGNTTPKKVISQTTNVITPNNTQGATRIVNDIAIDKLPNIVNQEDIQLFFFNNPNISAIQENTIRDAKGYPIYTRLRKSNIQKDALGTIVSGEANEGHFYKENGKFYIRIPQNFGYEICEISESDWIEFFLNIRDGSYKKIISPSIKRINCKMLIGGRMLGF